jgi:hypothetical protein
LLNRLALAEAADGNLPKARTLREQALAIGERWLAPCNPYSAIFVNDLAISFRAEGEYSEARRLYRKASAILDDCVQKSGVSPNPSTRATTALDEANIAAEMGDWAEAQRFIALRWTCGRRLLVPTIHTSRAAWMASPWPFPGSSMTAGAGDQRVRQRRAQAAHPQVTGPSPALPRDLEGRRACRRRATG